MQSARRVLHAGVDSKEDVEERSRVEGRETATMGIDERGKLGEEGIRDRGKVLAVKIHVEGRPQGRGLEQKGQNRCE